MPAGRRARPARVKVTPIEIRGARTHNLKGISCSIPGRALTVVTGPSGSGKSSLVFDTLYAEGQRRFVQSMSTYTRLFLERMERPDVDFLSNIPPAIALAQKNTIRNARSTVGTITEINDHLRLLFSQAGVVACPTCGGRVLVDSPESGLAEMETLVPATAVLIVAPVATLERPLGLVLKELLEAGHRRLWLEGRLQRLDEPAIGGVISDLVNDARSRSGSAPAAPSVARDRTGGTILPVVVDRIRSGTTARARVREALEAAFSLGAGRVQLVLVDQGRTIELDRRFTCRGCDLELPLPTPQLFSFNSPLGACPACEGFGRLTGIDIDKVIPDGSRSLADGAVVPWTTPSGLEMQEWLLRAARQHGVATDCAWTALDEAGRSLVLDGEPAGAKGRRQRFPGVHGFFRWLESKRYKTHIRVLLARYRGYAPCTSCSGTRLRPEALTARVGGLTIAEVTELGIDRARRWAEGLGGDARLSSRSGILLEGIQARFGYLLAVGLDYLSLSRQARTLSGGEAQRIHLASALGSALTDTLYCLDEPTVGLHARDSKRLLEVLRKLVDAGNTVVVVEHDPVLIEGAEHVIDIGPGGGRGGGEIVWAGPAAGLRSASSLTGRLLQTRFSGRPSVRRTVPLEGPCVWIRGARENNLAAIDVRIPVGQLSCVTGVSGSGKSTLVEQVLYQGWLRERGLAAEPGACDSIDGFTNFSEAVLMSQAPVGRSARSNPATYLKAWDEVRRLFAETPAAKAARLAPGAFSFNAAGGRCEPCSGMGVVTLEMHFMADLTVTCEACNGRRFRPAVLAIRFRGRSIDEILAMTIDEAQTFFSDRPRVCARLRAIREVGLGYLTLGQSTATLSGGEAQRLKLATFVDAGEAAERRLLLFDEPTTGLHLSDIAQLVAVLHGLVDRGHTVVVVEHNLDFIAEADWMIELGPDGGVRGGHLVAEGPPREIAGRGETATGEALRPFFAFEEDKTVPATARAGRVRPSRSRAALRA